MEKSSKGLAKEYEEAYEQQVLGSNIHNEGISPKLAEVELGTPPRGWDTSAAKVLGSNMHNEMHDSS